jgi:hypothetical protein
MSEWYDCRREKTEMDRKDRERWRPVVGRRPVENNTFCDVNKTRVKGLNSKHDSTIKNESEIKNKISYADIVKGKWDWIYS